ncbi:MAG: hypothetical protein ACOCV4_08155 [Myxococcota bacterium]
MVRGLLPRQALLARAATLVAAMILVVPGPRRPARADAPDLAEFAGAYELRAPRGRAQKVIEHAIERVTAEMGLMRSTLAQERLQQDMSHSRKIRIRVDGQQVVVEMDGTRVEATVGEDHGSTVKLPNGKWARPVHRFENGQLVQELLTRRGTRRNTFALAHGGRELRLDVEISSPRLPSDVEYALRYRRL